MDLAQGERRKAPLRSDWPWLLPSFRQTRIAVYIANLDHHLRIVQTSMEAYNVSRQARLKNLRETKDQQQDSGASSSSSAAAAGSSSSIHPFRRAFLSSQRTSLRPSRTLKQAADDEEDEGAASAAAAAADLANPSSESSAQRLADSSAEGLLLRRFRNWDPMTGQARDGTWSTVKGIEDEVKGVQEEVLREEEARRVRELDLAGIAPKRVNWDLKRDMLKRLKKVERRDREARLILIRE